MNKTCKSILRRWTSYTKKCY